MLELKESNSPYWLVGLNKGRYVVGSTGNIPCYYKSKGKQYELAQNMLNHKGIDEVYLLSGLHWDNMPMDSNKEIVGYLKNKGTLMGTKEDVNSSGLELKEEKEEALPKKTKLVSNKGMALESIDKDLIDRFNNTLANGHSDDFFKDYNKEELKQFDEYLLSLDQPQLVKDIVHWQIRNAIDQYDKIERGKSIKNKNLKESKIITPIGNPQTAGSFVNIDVDLDHMEVSDFIVRLAQAIRSEQTAILEYVALMSANGITNEEKENIRRIMEEEKNHMCALSAMLYKQVLLNHQQNMNEAGEEFVLPTFGAQELEENKALKESIDNMVNYFLQKDIKTESTENTTKYQFKLNESIDVETSSTISQNQYNIRIDVKYDEDFIGYVSDNLKNAIMQFNAEHGSSGYGFAEDKYSIGNGELEVMLITLDGIFEGEANSEFVKSATKELVNMASTPEYFLEAEF